MVKIEISNRAMYFLVAFGIIALFAVGVFANSHPIPNPGHDAGSIRDVCKSNGANCHFLPGLQTNLGLIEENNEICYTPDSATSCTTQSETCTESTSLMIENAFGTCDADEGMGDPYFLCTQACESIVACDGRTKTSFSCGATAVNYNQASVDSCTDSGSYPDSTMDITCDCSLSGSTTYKTEISNSGPLCFQTSGGQAVTVVSAVCNDGQKFRSGDNQIIEQWCGTTLPNSGSGCVAFLQKWDHNDNNPDAIDELGCGISSGRLFVRTDSANGDDDPMGEGSICGAVCGATVLNL